MQIFVLIGLFIAEKSCHKLNMNAVDKKLWNSTLIPMNQEIVISGNRAVYTHWTTIFFSHGKIYDFSSGCLRR